MQSWGPPRRCTREPPPLRPSPPNLPPDAPASPYRGRSNHGIRVTVSRDVDMKRKVDTTSVIQSPPHPAAATTQQGGKREEEKERKERKGREGEKVVAPGSLAGPRAELLGRERSLQL